MSRGISTVHQLKGLHQKYCSLYSANSATKSSAVRHSAIPFNHIACINGNEFSSKAHGASIGGIRHLPYLVFDLNFVRHLSTGQRSFEAAGGPPPSPPDGTSGGSATSGDGGSSDDNRLVCPKCGSPCEHVNAFVAATR